jgi:hypothetical protein
VSSAEPGEVSREEFDLRQSKVNALDEVIRRVSDGARFQLEEIENRQARQEEFLKRIAKHLGIGAPDES